MSMIVSLSSCFWFPMVNNVLFLVSYGLQGTASGFLWFTRYCFWFPMVYMVLFLISYGLQGTVSGFLWLTRYCFWLPMVYQVLFLVSYGLQQPTGTVSGFLWYARYCFWFPIITKVMFLISYGLQGTVSGFLWFTRYCFWTFLYLPGTLNIFVLIIVETTCQTVTLLYVRYEFIYQNISLTHSRSEVEYLTESFCLVDLNTVLLIHCVISSCII